MDRIDRRDTTMCSQKMAPYYREYSLDQPSTPKNHRISSLSIENQIVSSQNKQEYLKLDSNQPTVTKSPRKLSQGPRRPSSISSNKPAKKGPENQVMAQVLAAFNEAGKKHNKKKPPKFVVNKKQSAMDLEIEKYRRFFS